MTTYFETADGKIVNNHDVTRAYKETDGSVPFKKFSQDWLNVLGAKKIPNITVDRLLQEGNFREAVALFDERYHVGKERAKNIVSCMRTALGC